MSFSKTPQRSLQEQAGEHHADPVLMFITTVQIILLSGSPPSPAHRDPGIVRFSDIGGKHREVCPMLLAY